MARPLPRRLAMRSVHNGGMTDQDDASSALPPAEQLLTLLAVAEEGNESAAAELLGVGQSSVNRRLAALQRRTETPLTRRTAAGTRLTPAGAALLPYAREVRDALSSAARLLGPEGATPLRVSVGVSPHLVPRLAAALAGAASLAEPLELTLEERPSSDLLAAVRGGRLDAALTLWAPAGTEPGFSTESLGIDRVVLAAPAGSGVIRSGKVDASELRRTTLFLPGASHVSDRGREFARELGLRPTQVVELSGPAAVRAAVLAGQGAGATLASYVNAEAAAAWLVTAPLRVENDVTAEGGRGAPAPGTELQGQAPDSVGIWLLTSDAAPVEAARRLGELARRAVGDTALH